MFRKVSYRKVSRAIRKWAGKNRRSSFTDMSDYRGFCARAVNDPIVFNTFRRARVYTGAVEGLRRELGAEAVKVAVDRHPHYRNLLDAFRRNDTVGTPFTYAYDGFGEFSPTTLRYVKVLSDVEHLFGDLSGKKILEIGGGFGGQCRIVKCRFNVASYTIFDLPEPGELSRKYLAHLDIHDVSINPIQSSAVQPDLVISNYALSEIRRSHQDAYFNKAIAGAKSGYLIWNEVASRPHSKEMLPENDLPYSAEEFASKIPGARIAGTIPLILSDDMARGNCLIYWK